jgi:hypothetical protein
MIKVMVAGHKPNGDRVRLDVGIELVAHAKAWMLSVRSGRSKPQYYAYSLVSSPVATTDCREILLVENAEGLWSG